ncbi:MAG: replication initiation factor domain-containing protein [Anaerolineales bacterium]
MDEITCGIHWLAFTVHAPRQSGLDLHATIFENYIGPLQEIEHGGRGFREILQAALAFKLYLTPIRLEGEYFHFEIPGKACEAIPNTCFQALVEYLVTFHPEKYRFKRIDLAIDRVPFEPQQVEKAIREEKVRTDAKRETLKIYNSPYEKKDNGELGTYTVQLGSNQSERMITAYNRRGYTRLEFQVKDKRADLIALDLLKGPNFDHWFSVIVSHLRDFIDIETDWWTQFIAGQGRANQTVTTPKEVTVDRTMHWLFHAVAPAVSAMNDAVSDEVPQLLVEVGRKHRGPRYDHLFTTYGDRSPVTKKSGEPGGKNAK